MGFGDKKPGGRFITISHGKFRLRLKEPSENSETRTITYDDGKPPKEVHELVQGFIEGRIKNVELKETKFGEKLYIYVNSDNEDLIIQLPVQRQSGGISNHFDYFAKTCQSIDLSLPIVFGTAEEETKNGKTTTKLFAFHKVEGENKGLSFNFTKDNPNGIPQWEKKMVMGKETWDNTLYSEFLYNVVRDWIGANFSNEQDEEVDVDQAPPRYFGEPVDENAEFNAKVAELAGSKMEEKKEAQKNFQSPFETK